MKMMKMM
jgi:hypothetical protein